jgi:hypothetical protein
MPAAGVVDLPAGIASEKRRGAMKKAPRKTAKATGQKRKPVMRHGRDGVRAPSKRAKPSRKSSAKPAAASLRK